MRCVLHTLLLLHEGQCWQCRRLSQHAIPREPRLQRARTTLTAVTEATGAPSHVERVVGSLAATTLALLAGDEAAAKALAGSAEQKRETVRLALEAYDVCKSGTLSYEEACALFTQLARSIVKELAESKDTREAARAQARCVPDNGGRGAIDRVASKLMLLAYTNC